MITTLIRFLAIQLLASDWRALREGVDHLRATEPLVHRRLSLTAQCLLVTGEDHRHSQHPGFDIVAILRAVYFRLMAGSHQGASTIDQQLVRVLTGRYERTLRRKLREILLAVLLKHYVPVHELPALYLLVGYYGWRMNGLRQACLRLRIDPLTCTSPEAASLVARLKYPQPRTISARRAKQIAVRTTHLLHLRERHLQDGTYAYLTPSSPEPVSATTAGGAASTISAT